ncbi:uncharacterized protein OGAPODRAFT_93037, partial [Ogataea polymorpha]|uniref:uncharacterized protein n=1 Tax=Ogataea polymorpha TaxID=460523 RepID=UPI0007F3426E
MKSVYQVGPVCALTVFMDRYLFAGEGPNLVAYEIATGERIVCQPVFSRNKIHGISVFGSDLHTAQLCIWGGRSLALLAWRQLLEGDPDELMIGDWIKDAQFSLDGAVVYCLHAHNVVVAVDVARKRLLETRSCGEKSILYTGCLRVLPNKVLVCAGTVMDGILVWSYDDCQVEHRLHGHMGSIFGLWTSNDGRWLVSCSDDRSIRVWNLGSGEQVATGWGHGSRIWWLRIYAEEEGRFSVLSGSEDLTCRTWRFEQGNAALEPVDVFETHTGRNVWSGAVCDALGLGFSGGADGAITVSDLAENQREGAANAAWTLEQIAEQTGATFARGEIVKEYYDTGSELVAATSCGKVLRLRNGLWELVLTDPRFEKFSLVRGFDTGVVLIANKMGDLLILGNGSKAEHRIKLECGVVSNMLTATSNGRQFVLVENVLEAPLVLLELVEMAVVSERKLSKPAGKFVMSAFDVDVESGVVVVGSRFATLAVFAGDEQPAEPRVWRNFLKGDTVSSVEILDSASLETLVVMKDREYGIVRCAGELEVLQTNRLQRGFLEGGYFEHGDLLLYGFRSDTFFLWNETKQLELLRETCGGPHRQWSFRPGSGGGHRLFYTRSSSVHFRQTGARIAPETLRTGLHGREIRSVAACKTSTGHLLVTGSEDTTVQVSRLTVDGGVVPLWCERQHGSGLQAVHFVNSDYFVSSSAREEVYLWKLCDEKYVRLHRTIRPRSSNPETRVMDFDAFEVCQHGRVAGFLLAAVYSDSSVRLWYYSYELNTFRLVVEDVYSSCCVLRVRLVVLDAIYVVLAATNGHLAVYRAGDGQGVFDVCGGAIDLVAVPRQAAQVPQLEQLLINQQIHQSSIKSFDLAVEGHTALVVTGGDDNGMAVSTLDFAAVELSSTYVASTASSTITDVVLCGPNRVLTTSVDQVVRVWRVPQLELETEQYTTVADTGCACLAGGLAVVGGAGLEVFQIDM